MRYLNRLGALLAVLIVGTTGAFAQTTINGSRTILGNWDASGANTTKACKSGTAAPGTCAVGECFFDTDATAGQNLYGCTATNTWTLMGDGGGTLSGGIKKLLQYDADGTGVEDSILSGATAGQITALGRIGQDSDGDGTGVTCITEDEAADRLYADKDCDSTQDAGELFLDLAGTVTGATADTGGTTTGAAITVAGGIGIETSRAGDTVTVTSTRHEASFTTQTTVTVTGATHGIGNDVLQVLCYDNSSPRKMVEPDTITVDDTSADVVITFFVAQTGKCVIQ